MRAVGAEKAQKGYCTLVGLRRDRGFLCRDRAFWFCVVTMGFVSRQDLVLVGCSWVAVVVALCRDNVATEVPLSRSRRSRQEVRVTGAWLRPRNFRPRQKIVVSQ